MSRLLSTAQLTTFDTIVSVIRANSILAAQFSIDRFYEFDPKLKSREFAGFPYIVVSIPDVDDMHVYAGDQDRRKKFRIDIMMCNEWVARDNVALLGSNLLSILDSSESTLAPLGFTIVDVNCDGHPLPVTHNSKEIIESRFILTLEADVSVH